MFPFAPVMITFFGIFYLKVVDLKHTYLLPRPAEKGAVQFPSVRIQVVNVRILPVLLGNQLGNVTFTTHSYTVAAVIDLPAMAFFYHMPHLVCPVREAFIKPVMEQ